MLKLLCAYRLPSGIYQYFGQLLHYYSLMSTFFRCLWLKPELNPEHDETR